MRSSAPTNDVNIVETVRQLVVCLDDKCLRRECTAREDFQKQEYRKKLFANAYEILLDWGEVIDKVDRNCWMEFCLD